MLAEFGSAVAAVATAIDIQERMARFNDMLDEEQRLMFRIGVHLGEVIVDEEDPGDLRRRRQPRRPHPGAWPSPAASPCRAPCATSPSCRSSTPSSTAASTRQERQPHAADLPCAAAPRRARARTTTLDGAAAYAALPRHRLGNDRKYGFDLALDKLMGQRKGMVIGRDIDQCDFVLPHTTVSRRHARLLLAGGVLQVEDLGSTNGTAVDGERGRLPANAGRCRPAASCKIGDDRRFAVGARRMTGR